MGLCPTCGEPNPDRARFFSRVRHAARLRGVRAERRVVTALFCDLVGSTALGEAHDPEVLEPLLARYFDDARAAVERHGGRADGVLLGESTYLLLRDAVRAERSSR